ncbi:NAD(P)H nitroreductase [Pseudoalteromonas denitrificans]|uniref:Putative NAD(P)H nitroreductase n=1 Tax=Pseudoalteromonas denitrificans DSM 6059 TaxID=1123010 RepID=A0A1I1NT60_9GAMM|nr:NAD(P)H nitroreductase [Pseudoalteromonas denitrificans]SFD00747.1 Nitroreductase [Pseudoalteromonas denitrificans DSM 6059]
MNALDLLLNRQSDSKLQAPGPNQEQLNIIKQAALKVPDHGALTPWQFIIVQGDKRKLLGEIYHQSAIATLNPQIPADAKAIERSKEMPMRAPLIIIAIAKYKEHLKVPRVEQIQSAGCAVMAMQQAAYAQGLAGVWRTGSYASCNHVKAALNLSEQDEIVGYLYLGTAANDFIKPHRHDVSEFFSELK